MKPITVHVLPSGPNPWKVVLIMEELSLPYTIKSFPFSQVKKPPFTTINPNGRVPAIEDPNTTPGNPQLVLWESGAIIQYLIATYDSKRILTYDSIPEKWQLDQWLFFQCSGQGPYFGQASWFNVIHHEAIPSARERYNNEARRILTVLNTALEGRDWLVGDKMTYADLAFVTWNELLDMLQVVKTKEERFSGLENVEKWHKRMVEREAFKKVWGLRDECMEEQGLNPRTGMPRQYENREEYDKDIADGKA